MAENILGLLLVTSSSRGRHVFRYPPDPASPNVRLAQPIYPSATFTAADMDVEYKLPRGSSGLGGALRRKLYGGGEDMSSNASIRRSLFGGSSSKNRKKGNSRQKNKEKRDDLYARYMNPEAEGVGGRRGEGRSDDSDLERGRASSSGSDGSSSSSDEDSDYEFLWSAGNGPTVNHNNSHNHPTTTINNGTGQYRKESRQPYPEEKERRDSNPGLRSLESSTILGDPSRRGSASTTTATVTGVDHLPSSSALDTGESGITSRKVLESQYNYALGWPLETLSDMLSPPRAACHRKFELCVGNIVFLGHPVCSGPDGKWEAPLEEEEEELDERAPSRGRRMRDPAAQPSGLDTVVEGREADHRASNPNSSGRVEPLSTSKSHQRNANSESSQPKISNDGNDSDDDKPPSLNMFHLVLIIDKPDPKAGTESHDEHHSQTLGMYDEVYREIAFKWTAAAFKLQCENNFIAKQTWTMVKYKEKCLNEGITITDCCRWINAHCALDRTLNTLYLQLHQLRTQPTNALHSYLPTTFTTNLCDMTVQTILSTRAANAEEEWAHWGEIDESSDSETSESDGEDWDEVGAGGGGGKKHEIKVHPWQTLLLIDDDASQRANEISLAIIGLGIGADDSTGGAGERRGSKATIATTTAEEDETALMKALIEACDVTKPLFEIAHALRYDLEGIVIPLARELVQNRRAILIDVINTRLRTVVMPTTIDEHTASFDQYSARYTRLFPNLRSFPKFISSISASPIPFRETLPSDPDLETRKTYMAALVWLLKQDLVVQIHTRARVFARKEVKVEAWKRLWKRRRERWLSAQKDRENTDIMRSPTGSDLITPRAVNGVVSNPIDSMAITATVPSPKVRTDQQPSYMDYDPALEMDSDEEFDTQGQGHSTAVSFSVHVDQPPKSEIPNFESSFIFKPARAQKEEARWLRVIREASDEVWASKFDLCVQYLDGWTTIEEISYRTGLPRRELEKILQLYKDDIVTSLHP
ncbi:hypothetical protein IAR55_006910 [Kwoniella newhampshirensis]|uniref:Nitrogen permease regulator 3 n=1 Tax=Kwoniella newhampshirensis TaxID=1651941 RepID=A0AAW0YTP1_9TREE